MSAPQLHRTIAVAALVGMALGPTHAWAQADARPHPPPAAAAGQREVQRLALVIGNAAYKEGALANPVNDARAMAHALQESGFTVLLHTDLDHRAMMQAVREFGSRLRQGGVGLFYFAGHGVQIRGRNYLVPIGADIQREDEVAYAALDAQAVLDKMESAGNGTNLLILDACRNNPFARGFRSSASGLAQMEAPVGTMVAFATAPGMVASDGQGSNGLYTQNLLEAMRKPGLKVEDVFKQVRVAVRRDSGGKQVPWESTSLEGDLYFVEPGRLAAAAAVAEARPDEVLWSAIGLGSDPAELRAFLRRYPDSRHAEEARRRLAAASPASVAVPAPLPMPAATSGAITPSQPSSGPTSEPTIPDAIPREAVGRPVAVLEPAIPGAAPRTALGPPEARPEPAGSHPQGYRVGDTWNYQVVDLWRGEVTGNYTRRIARIGSGADWFTFAGSRFDPWGRPLRLEDPKADRRREFAPFMPRGWEDWQPGRSLPVAFTETMTTLMGAPVWRCEHEGTLRQVRVERVRVPAGEFMARRIEIDARCKREVPGQTNSLNPWKQVLWYVPELRHYAAMETEWRNGAGKLDKREREELTSFDLRGAELASR